MENRISSFQPIVDTHSEILILGSIPGAKSLEMEQYYAHPQNQFWKIIFEILGHDFTTNYEERLAILKQHGIALWDVIDTCERKGSLDTAIRNEEANDILGLLELYPNIKAIFCNGQKSFKNLQKIFHKNPPLPTYVLPSTSPAHTMHYENKLKSWFKMKEFI